MFFADTVAVMASNSLPTRSRPALAQSLPITKVSGLFTPSDAFDAPPTAQSDGVS